MRSDTLNRINATPLTYPYFDEDALHAIEPMEVRLKISTFEVSDKIAKEYGFDRDRAPEMFLAQFQAGRHVAQKLESTGMSNLRAAELSGVDPAMISKYICGKRPFSPGAALITPFAYNVMMESCHKLMFGTEGKIILPSVYSEMVRAIAMISSEAKEALLRKAQLQMTLYEKQNPQKIQNAPHREVSTLIGERIFELIYDKGTQGYLLFGQETPYGIRNFIRQFILEDFKRESPRLSSLMYLSFETGLALDYFIAEDFTKKVPCFYRAGEEVLEVTDSATLKIIGICSSLPVEARCKLVGEVIGAGLGAEFLQ